MNTFIRITTGLLRETSRQSTRLLRTLAGGAAGVVQEARGRAAAPKPGMDDITLARKVETELFRPRGAPKGSVDVNVVEGVVYLRGQVKRPDQIAELERRTREIPEVRGVENLLHLHKTPSPTRADSPKRAQKSPRSPKPAPRKRTSATRVRTTAEAPSTAAASAPASSPRRQRASTPASRSPRRPARSTPSGSAPEAAGVATAEAISRSGEPTVGAAETPSPATGARRPPFAAEPAAAEAARAETTPETPVTPATDTEATTGSAPQAGAGDLGGEAIPGEPPVEES
ncbi:MAG TPA: BON domain-containing protein [Solirubrobacteraceae bacterium]|nr:BON domain-containing protein [Solirubrobacteraceae bacterium]